MVIKIKAITIQKTLSLGLVTGKENIKLTAPSINSKRQNIGTYIKTLFFMRLP